MSPSLAHDPDDPGLTPAASIVLDAANAGLPAYVERARKAFNVPGIAVAIVKDGHSVFEQGFGVRNMRDGKPVSPHTMFCIASNTKSLDASGNVFFGFLVTASNSAGLVSGFARIGADGSGAWVAANAALGVATPINSATNAAPALSPDGKTLYLAVATVPSSGNPTGYLLALDSTTLATKSSASLIDPSTLAAAWVSDSSTSSPMVGPDGDVCFGVLESNFPAHNDRGWLLHFDATLTVVKTPGSFGWDNTPSLVPAAIVGFYTGTSAYLLLTKYNNYAAVGTGDGRNRMAILDPNQTQADPIAGNPVMKEVITLLGQTSDATDFPTLPGAVKEWCVNTAAVDPITGSVFMNSEDGIVYRWDLDSGQISQRIQLDAGFAQAYTPTALGPDGSVYAINGSILHAIRN